MSGNNPIVTSTFQTFIPGGIGLEIETKALVTRDSFSRMIAKLILTSLWQSLFSDS